MDGYSTDGQWKPPEAFQPCRNIVKRLRTAPIRIRARARPERPADRHAARLGALGFAGLADAPVVIDWSSRFRRQVVHAKGAGLSANDPGSSSRTVCPSCPCRLYSMINCVKPPPFRTSHIADLRCRFPIARRPSALLPALAGSQGLRCRGDRHHPCRTDVPARRDHADNYRHGRSGEAIERMC